MGKKVMARAIGLVLSGALVAGAASAAGQEPAQSGTATVTVQGVEVAIDPATGRLVAPTAAQRAALSAAMLEQAHAQRAAGGMALRPLDEAAAARTLRRPTSGRYAAYMQVPETLVTSLVAETRPDGSVTIRHEDEPASTAPGAPEVLQ